MGTTRSRRDFLGGAALAAALALGGCAWTAPAPDITQREDLAPSVGTLATAGGRGDEARRMPGAAVATPFRPGERVADWRGRSVNAGRVGKAAYLYTPDFRTGMVGGSPERLPADLDYARGDWQVECGGEGRPWRCRLQVISSVRQAGNAEAALRVRFLPDGPGLVVCAGAADAGSPGIQAGPEGTPMRFGGAAGCFSAADSAGILADLGRVESFAYRYDSGIYGRVSGWRPTFGLSEAIELMRWMEARATGR
jgi:hypothetical protein